MHCSSLCLHCSRPYRDRRLSTPASSSTRRSSRRSSASGRRPYPLASTGTFSSLPAFSFLGARSSSSEQRRVRAVVVRRTGQGSPPRFDSSRSNPLHLAPKLVHPSTSATVPYPGRIGLAPSSDRRSPSSAPNRPTVSSIALYSPSPTLSPPKSAASAAVLPPRRRRRAERRPRAPPGLPVPARGPTPRAPPPLDLPGARPASPCRRLALPPPERSRRRRPWPCAAASRPAAWGHWPSPAPPRRRPTPPPAGSPRAAPPLPRRRRGLLRA